MKIVLEYKKGIEENAGIYFDKAKKAKLKIEGAKETVERTLKKKAKVIAKKEIAKVDRKRAWYEKFRWFFTSDGMLVVGGRDSTSNEIVVKKHTEPHDFVFHTDMAGSPFFVLKTDGKEPSDAAMDEAAIATASFSRAWKLGLPVQDVFHVKPEQVSKEAQAGEYMAKGAFMIRGKTTYHHPKVGLAAGMTKDGAPMCGPESSVRANCEKTVTITQGQDKPSDAAKKLRKLLTYEDLDELVRMLPPGQVKIITSSQASRTR